MARSLEEVPIASCGQRKELLVPEVGDILPGSEQGSRKRKTKQTVKVVCVHHPSSSPPTLYQLAYFLSLFWFFYEREREKERERA